MCGALATSSPAASSSAHEKSRRSLTFVEIAVRSRRSPISATSAREALGEQLQAHRLGPAGNRRRGRPGLRRRALPRRAADPPGASTSRAPALLDDRGARPLEDERGAREACARGESLALEARHFEPAPAEARAAPRRRPRASCGTTGAGAVSGAVPLAAASTRNDLDLDRTRVRALPEQLLVTPLEARREVGSRLPVELDRGVLAGEAQLDEAAADRRCTRARRPRPPPRRSPHPSSASNIAPRRARARSSASSTCRSAKRSTAAQAQCPRALSSAACAGTSTCVDAQPRGDGAWRAGRPRRRTRRAHARPGRGRGAARRAGSRRPSPRRRSASSPASSASPRLARRSRLRPRARARPGVAAAGSASIGISNRSGSSRPSRRLTSVSVSGPPAP